MRISDWSSDVCSSDLQLAFELDLISELLNVGFLTSTYDRDRQILGDGASAVRDKRGQAIHARIIINIGVAIAENVHELNVFAHLDQIGRASFRERVCQNV